MFESASTLNLLVNAGIAGVFAVFALVLVREFLTYLRLQSEQWRDFIAQQGEKTDMALEKSNERSEQLGKAIAHLDGTVRALAVQIRGTDPNGKS